LFCGGVLQAVARSARIPEVATVEIPLRDVVLEWGKVGGIHIALRVAFCYSVVRVCSGNCNGNGTRIRSAGEDAQDGSAIAVSGGGIMAVAARYVVVDRQIRIEYLQLAKSFDLMKGIQSSRFRRGQGVALELRFFGDYA